MKELTLHRILDGLQKARSEHPAFSENGGGIFEAVSTMTEELGEVATAVNDGEPPERIAEELVDLIVTAIRTLQREYDDGQS